MSPLRRYLAYFRGHVPTLLVVGVLVVVVAAVPAVAALLLKQTVDRLLVARDADAVVPLAMAYVALFALHGVGTLVRTRLSKGVAWQVTAQLREQVFAHLLSLPPAQQAHTGVRLARLTDEVDELQYGVSALVTLVRNPLEIIGLTAVALWLAPDLAVWVVPIFVIVALGVRQSGRWVRRLAVDKRQARARLLHELSDQLGGWRTLQRFGVQTQETARFALRNAEDEQSRLALEVGRVVPTVLTRVVAASGLAALLVVGGRQVAAGTLDAGSLVAFAVALAALTRPLSGLSEVWSLLQRALGALEAVHVVLDTPPAVAEPASPQALPAGPLGLALRDVAVDYGDGAVVAGVDLAVAAGELVVFVGASGGGKTSLLRTLTRERDPSHGEVQLGGVAVTALALAELRRAVAVVAQDEVLFDRSVRDNVDLRGERDEAGIWRALEEAEAADFVRALPDGLDTSVGQLGERLSGGQRQRLALARALCAGARVLVLDEATAQLDLHTEAALLETLSRLRGRYTLLVAAHRLQSAVLADRVVVLQDGAVVEIGPHTELLASPGAYARLWAAREAS